ncbi:unnamed protein product [Pleuronectes platessa]|uniref:Uncharacterized protein n=1 Tax=Pleuronectes platessa TaxID=8262 RepID=A0A9N7YRU3_PLEPL|nr:unnamed protein product [Pleuronectes platessa]
MGREGLWFVSGSTPRRDNQRRTWIDLSKNPRVSLPCLVPLSKAPYSPNICSPSAVHGDSDVPRSRPSHPQPSSSLASFHARGLKHGSASLRPSHPHPLPHPPSEYF